MKKFIPILSSLFLIGILIGCSGHHMRKGDRYFDNYAYANAVKHYSKAYDKMNNEKAERSLAISYMKMSNPEISGSYFSKVVNRSSPAAIDYLNYAKVLMETGKYEEAIPWIEKYLAFNENDLLAQLLLASCKSVDERYIDTTLFELTPVPTDDFSNSFGTVTYKNGTVFTADKEVFSGNRKSQWTGKSYLNLYYMEKGENGNWLPPSALKGDINGSFHDGPATFSKDGKTVYFTRSNYYKNKRITNDENICNLKIFKASLVDGKWKNLEEYPFNSDDYSVGHPTLSEDGKTLYFVSDMPGGIGGTDLYKSELKNGKWSAPENLGETINTRGNEMFPYIHCDGSLYFSSDSHNSMGGLDVFITYFTGEEWATPENLNYPLNSSKDDFSFSLNEDNITGFVSSSRTQADKIYAFTKKPPTFNLYGFTRKKGTQIPVSNVTIKITEATSGNVIEMQSDEEGKFSLQLEPESEYLLLCTKEGCFTRTDNISTLGKKYSEDFYADFEVEEIIIDKPIVLENIYYDFDKWDIRPDAAKELDHLVKLLQDNPQIEIELSSHTDSRGADNYNLVLSDRRANSAVSYLISKGISKKRVSSKGYGETQLVNQCSNKTPCSEEEHQANRRTEFKVTKINK